MGTTVEAVEDSRFWTPVRMTDVVFACSSANPPWTWTAEGTPGKSILFRSFLKKLRSITSD